MGPVQRDMNRSTDSKVLLDNNAGFQLLEPSWDQGRRDISELSRSGKKDHSESQAQTHVSTQKEIVFLKEQMERAPRMKLNAPSPPPVGIRTDPIPAFRTGEQSKTAAVQPPYETSVSLISGPPLEDSTRPLGEVPRDVAFMRHIQVR